MISAASRRYQATAKGKAKLARAHKKYRESPHGREVCRRRDRKAKLKLYGLSVAEYDLLLQKQNGVCAICGGKEVNRKGNIDFNVDHCHTAGFIRGLLCHNCNTALGLFKDSIKALLTAVKYLENNNG